MQYLNSTFTVEPAASTDGLSCPRCVFGPKWGEHAAGCSAAKQATCYRCGDDIPSGLTLPACARCSKVLLACLDRTPGCRPVEEIEPGVAYEFNPLNGIPR